MMKEAEAVAKCCDGSVRDGKELRWKRKRWQRVVVKAEAVANCGDESGSGGKE